MRLYDYPASCNCYKVRLLLAHLGRPYERVPVDIFAGDTLTDEYATDDPARTTPVLETDDGRYLLESNAILVYVTRGTPYLRDDPFELAQVVRWLVYEQTDVIPTMGDLRFRLLVGRLQPSDPNAIRRKEHALEVLRLLDDRRHEPHDRDKSDAEAVRRVARTCASSRDEYHRCLVRSPRLIAPTKLLAVAGLAVINGCVVRATAFSSATAIASPMQHLYSAKCTVWTGQWSAAEAPATIDALKLGPAAFNRLSPRAAILRPPTVLLPSRKHGDPLYHVVSFFNISARARHGITLRVLEGTERAAILFDGYARWRELVSGRLPLIKAPTSVRFPLCPDRQTRKPLVTQYGVSFLMRRPGCFVVQVQATGQQKRYRARLRVLVPHC